MTHGHAHEEAEHANHASHDPFNKRVAMTMMIVAALLAGVKVLAHRTHNATLSEQIAASAANTQASNQWSFFQAKKMRELMANSEAKQLIPANLPSMTKEGTTPPLKNRDKLKETIAKELKTEHVDHIDEEAEKIVAAGEKRFQELLSKGVPAERAEMIADSEMKGLRYRTESSVIMTRAIEKEKAAKDALQHGEHYHHQAAYFDLGELFVELALVLCSIAILTKQRNFWYGGMGVCGVGIVVVVLGLIISDGHGAKPHGSGEHGSESQEHHLPIKMSEKSSPQSSH